MSSILIATATNFFLRFQRPLEFGGILCHMKCKCGTKLIGKFKSLGWCATCNAKRMGVVRLVSKADFFPSGPVVAGYDAKELFDELSTNTEPGAVDNFNEESQSIGGLRCIAMSDVGSYGVEMTWINEDNDETMVLVDHGDVDLWMTERAEYAD